MWTCLQGLMKIQQWLFELLRKQSVMDGRTHGRTDNVKTVYPLQTKFAGGIININSLHVRWVFMLFCHLLTFFQKNTFIQKIKTISVKRFGSRSGPTFLSVLIRIQTFCKGYKQVTKIAISKQRVKPKHDEPNNVTGWNTLISLEIFLIWSVLPVCLKGSHYPPSSFM